MSDDEREDDDAIERDLDNEEQAAMPAIAQDEFVTQTLAPVKGIDDKLVTYLAVLVYNELGGFADYGHLIGQTSQEIRSAIMQRNNTFLNSRKQIWDQTPENVRDGYRTRYHNRISNSDRKNLEYLYLAATDIVSKIRDVHTISFSSGKQKRQRVQTKRRTNPDDDTEILQPSTRKQRRKKRRAGASSSTDAGDNADGDYEHRGFDLDTFRDELTALEAKNKYTLPDFAKFPKKRKEDIVNNVVAPLGAVLNEQIEDYVQDIDARDGALRSSEKASRSRGRLIMSTTWCHKVCPKLNDVSGLLQKHNGQKKVWAQEQRKYRAEMDRVINTDDFKQKSREMQMKSNS